jgi:hypothetical protein
MTFATFLYPIYPTVQQTTPDDYACTTRGGGNHTVLLPPLPDNLYTNPAGYAILQAHNGPFENTETYPMNGDRNPLSDIARPPFGSNDGQ